MTMKKDLAYPVGFFITRTQRELQKHFFRRTRKYRITPEQWLLLAVLTGKKGVSPTELAKISLRDKPYTTRLIGKLEKRGILRRESNPGDKRSCLIFLTEQGNIIKEKIFPIIIEINNWATEAMSEEEVGQLKFLLNKMYNHIKD